MMYFPDPDLQYFHLHYFPDLPIIITVRDIIRVFEEITKVNGVLTV